MQDLDVVLRRQVDVRALSDRGLRAQRVGRRRRHQRDDDAGEEIREFRAHRTVSYSGPNASSTLPPRTKSEYPEFTNTMPSAIVAPGPLIDAPFAGTPFTVLNSREVLNSHRSRPPLTAYARN